MDSRNAQEIVLTDHNYTRQDVLGYYLRPTRNLFFKKRTKLVKEDIDVEIETALSPPQYDSVKSRQFMEECEKFVMFARTARLEESSEDWEVSIPRVGWSNEQQTLFQRVVKILHADRLARLALQGSWSEPAKRRALVDRSAQRFREAMAHVSWDARLTQWLHSLLIEHLDIAYLAAYLDILQTLKVRIPTLIDRLLAGTSSGKVPVVQEGMNLLLKRPWDPAASTINSQKLGKLPNNPVIILVPTYFKKQPTVLTPRSHLWSSHLSSLATVLPVVPTVGTISPYMTCPAYLEQMMSATKARLAAARSEYPTRPVVLVGWRSGAAVALQAAASEAVTAVVALGFATRTVEGPRGDPDDSLYSLTCPVLFVNGEQASTARIEDLEEIRIKMIGQTGLVVVGSSDDCLRMRRRHKMTIGVTQSLVDRAVLEEIGEFLASAIMMPSPPQRLGRRPEPAFQRKRRFSTASSVDSETSLRGETPSKHMRQSLVSPYHKAMNGNTVPSSKRGRRGGLGSRSSKFLRDSRRLPNIKTLQTLSPVKRPERDPMSNRSENKQEPKSFAQLGPSGSAVSSSTSSQTVVTSSMQTYRIHGGRVSEILPKSAPPSDVMPLRVNSGTTVEDLKPSFVSPIRTLTAPAQRGSTPRPMGVPVRVPRPPLTRPASRLALGAPASKIAPAQNNVILVSDKRQTSPAPSGQNLKVASPIKSTTTNPKILKTSTSPVAKGQAIGRLSLDKRFVQTSPVLQQKPIIVGHRALKTAVDSEHQEKPIVIVKSRNLAETETEKPLVYLQRGGEIVGDSERPMVIVKSRALSEGEKPNDVAVEPKRQQIVLSQNRPAKQVVLKTEGGEQFILQERVSSPSKYFYKYKLNPEQHEGVIYEVVDGS